MAKCNNGSKVQIQYKPMHLELNKFHIEFKYSNLCIMFLPSMLLIEYSGQVASKAAMLGAGAGAELEHMARQEIEFLHSYINI